MKYLKRIVLGLFSLLLLITAAIFILITFYKKEMVGMMTDYLKTNYGMALSIEDADVSFISNWPQASVQLKNVSLESISGPHKQEPMLKAGSLSLSFNLQKLLRKQFVVKSISLKDAEILLIKNEDGSRNFEFKRKTVIANDTSGNDGLAFELNKASIKTSRFRFINHAKKQKIELTFVNNSIHIHNAQDGMALSLKGDLLFAQLLFNEKKGAFLENTPAKVDLRADLFLKSKMIVVYPGSYTTIENHRYNLNAFIQLGDSARKLALRIESFDVDYQKGGKLLTPKIRNVLSNFSVEKPFDVKTLVIANLDIKEDPVLIVNINVKDNDIKIGNSKIPYSHVSFKGSILSLDSSRQRGRTEKARIYFKAIKGHLYDFPFTASASIVNLDSPAININGRLLIDAQKINYKIAQTFILKGNCVAKISYHGPTQHLNKNEFLQSPMRLNADLKFTNFSYQEKNKPFIYTVNGKANVNNTDLKFENLLLKTSAGNALLKGKAEGFVNYVLGYSNKIKASLSAKTDYFDLNTFLPQKKDSQQVVAKVPISAEKSKQSVDDSEFEFDASFSAKKMLIRKVESQNANVELSYKNKLLTIKSLSVNTCDGKLSASGTIYDLNKINARIDMQEIDINKLFNQFENFGQRAIDSKNLQGRVFVTARLKTDLDDKMEVIGKTMEGEVTLKLKDGHLLNFEPVQNVSDYIFRNRDFNDITFTELNETFRLKGFEMEIEELEIGSNVLNLYVKGVYNFKDRSNINMLIPWHNLKKRGKNYVPKNYGEGVDNTKGLKLNYSGPTNKMKLSLGHKTRDN